MAQTRSHDPLRNAAPAPVTARFAIEAQAEPAALVRLLDLFAQRSIVPTRVSAHRCGDALHTVITVQDIGEAIARNLCARMQNMIAVRAADLDYIDLSIIPPSPRSAAIAEA